MNFFHDFLILYIERISRLTSFIKINIFIKQLCRDGTAAFFSKKVQKKMNF